MSLIARGPALVRMRFLPGLKGVKGDLPDVEAGAGVAVDTAGSVLTVRQDWANVATSTPQTDLRVYEGLFRASGGGLERLSMADVVNASTGSDFSTVASVSAIRMGWSRATFRTSGYAFAGDGGAALYRRTASEPTHGLKVRTADRYTSAGVVDATNGGWWEVASDIITPEMAGGSLAVAIAGAMALGKPLHGLPNRVYEAATTITIDQPLTIELAYSCTLKYTPATGDFLSVTAGGGFVISGGQIEGHASATSGALLKILGPAPYGNYAPSVRSIRFVNGYDEVDAAAAFNGEFHDLTFSGPAHRAVHTGNSRNVLLGRNHFSGLRFDGKPGAPNGTFVMQTGGSDTTFTNMTSANADIDYHLVPAAGAAYLGNFIFQGVNFQGSNTNFKFEKGTGTLVANVLIANGSVYGTDNVVNDLVPSWLYDISTSNLQAFPAKFGAGHAFALAANPVSISNVIIDGGDPDNAHAPLPGSVGIKVGTGSFFWRVSNILFTALETNVNNEIPAEPTVSFSNCRGYYTSLVVAPTVAASPTSYRAGPTNESFLFRKTGAGGTFGLSMGGQTIAYGTETGFDKPITLTLNAHQQINIVYTGDAPTVIINRLE